MRSAIRILPAQSQAGLSRRQFSESSVCESCADPGSDASSTTAPIARAASGREPVRPSITSARCGPGLRAGSTRFALTDCDRSRQLFCSGHRCSCNVSVTFQCSTSTERLHVYDRPQRIALILLTAGGLPLAGLSLLLGDPLASGSVVIPALGSAVGGAMLMLELLAKRREREGGDSTRSRRGLTLVSRFIPAAIAALFGTAALIKLVDVGTGVTVAAYSIAAASLAIAAFVSWTEAGTRDSR